MAPTLKLSPEERIVYQRERNRRKQQTLRDRRKAAAIAAKAKEKEKEEDGGEEGGLAEGPNKTTASSSRLPVDEEHGLPGESAVREEFMVRDAGMRSEEMVEDVGRVETSKSAGELLERGEGSLTPASGATACGLFGRLTISLRNVFLLT